MKEHHGNIARSAAAPTWRHNFLVIFLTVITGMLVMIFQSSPMDEWLDFTLFIPIVLAACFWGRKGYLIVAILAACELASDVSFGYSYNITVIGHIVVFVSVSVIITEFANNRRQRIAAGERFLASVFSSIQDGISILDKDFTIVRVNSTMEKWYAHAMPLVGKKCYEAYHGRNTPCEMCPTHKALETGELAYEMLPLMGPDGKTRGWLDLYCFPHIDPTTGTMIGVIEYVRDITLQRQTELALRESEERFRQVVENLNEWVWEVDAEGLYTYASPAVQRILGYTPEEIVGKMHFYDLFAPEEREQVRKEAFEVIARRDSYKDFINRNVHKDGRIVVLSTSGVPVIDAKGNLIGYRGDDADITERVNSEKALRESESRYKSLFENSPVPLWEEDFSGVRRYLDGLRAQGVEDFRRYFEEHPDAAGECRRQARVIAVNQATLDMYEAGSFQELLATINTLFTPEMIEAFKKEAVALARGTRDFACETVATTLRAERKDIVIRWAVAPGSEHSLERVLVSTVDVSELKRLEREVRQSLKFKEDFMATMSHDLRTPLNIIIGSVDLVLKDKDLSLPDKRRKNLEHVLHSSDWLLHYIDNILETARIESGKLGLTPTQFSLKELVASTIDSCTPLIADDAEIELIHHVDEDVPELFTDRDKLSHVIANLVVNAIKFTHRGSIRVTGARIEGDPTKVRLTVADTGMGIPSEKRDVVFEQFKTLSPQPVRDHGGRGLGLSIVKKYSELLGGAVEVTSKEGTGSTFTVTLPIRIEKKENV